MEAPFTEKGSCRWKEYKLGGLKSDFCPTCKVHDEISNRELRRKYKTKDGLAGCCLKLASGSTNDESQSNGVTVSTRRKRKTTEKPEATATGKMNWQKSKKKTSKRRKSIEASKNAEKVFVSGKVKDGLLRASLAYIAGTKSIVLPKPVENKKAPPSKKTEYRTTATGAKILNGAVQLLRPDNPNSYRAAIVEKSVATAPSLSIKPHPALKDVTNLTSQNTTESSAEADSLSKKVAADKRSKVDESTRSKMSAQFIDALKSYTTPEARRPYLACFADCKKPDVEQLTCMNITDYEFHLAKIHAKCPGPLKMPHKKEISRQRTPQQTLERFMRFLDQPGNLQRCAFGTRVLSLCKGKSVTELESIETLKKVQSLAVDFTLSLDSELSAEDVPTDDCRCTKLERDTHRRCMLDRNHDANCKFTPKGSMCRTTAIKLIKTLTGGEVKRLAGLDDAKAVEGRENFVAMRDAAEKLHSDDPATKEEIIDSINKTEVHHQTDFVDHLQRNSNQACNCLSCGFSRPAAKLCHGNHAASCVECVQGFEVMHSLERKLEERKEEASKQTQLPMMQMQENDELSYQLTVIKQNLLVYRSHLARHKAEGDFDNEETANLPDDTAIVTSDWKMKLLSCFFRENQGRWFGKRGTSCLGFMIMSNPTDPVVKEKGLKDVQFIMHFSDDTLQGEHSVACAKADVHRNHLPEQVTKSIFRTDGAGCFKSAFHKAAQPFWQMWTGVEETTLRTGITPAGDGKSPLDGMFGRLNSILSTAVDNGHSYYDAGSAMDAVEGSGGLSATKFFVFKPDRSCRLFAGFSGDTIKWGDILRTELNQGTFQLRAFEHSGYGSGVLINPSQARFSTVSPLTDALIKKGKNLLSNPLPFDHKAIREMIEGYLSSFEKTSLAERVDVMIGIIEREHVKNLVFPALNKVAPRAIDLRSGSNTKQDISCLVQSNGDSHNHPNQRHQRRQNRIKVSVEAVIDKEEKMRQEMTAAGVFLCPVRCPRSLHCCAKPGFLTEANRDKHVAKGKHIFPRGFNATDRAIDMASTAGGLMMIGTHKDRKKTSQASTKTFPSSGDCQAAVDACCFQQFHRPAKKEPHQKTRKLQEELDRIFAMRPKQTAFQARQIMKARIDPKDNGLMFCWAKRGEFMAKSDPRYKTWKCSICGQKPCDCNGVLPSEEQMTAAFSTRAAKEKKDGELKDCSEARGRKKD